MPHPFHLALVMVMAFSPPALALDPVFPGTARETAAATETGSDYALPVGPWDGSAFLSRRVEGTVTRRAFRIEGPQSTIDLMAALRPQVQADGWRILYECDAPVCGGFDFRFATEILPEPEMHVDLGDFRVLSADRGDEVLNLIVSRSLRAGFVQVTLASPGGVAEPGLAPPLQSAVPPAAEPLALPELAPLPPPQVAAPAPEDGPVNMGDLMARMLVEGHVVLPGLRFASGASTLEPGDYPALAELAAWLRTDPSRRIVLVGHTDAAGGLEANIALSRRRAAAVRDELVAAHNVDGAQVEADGVGYLAPLASNTTEAGRQANRRVDAVLLAPGG